MAGYEADIMAGRHVAAAYDQAGRNIEGNLKQLGAAVTQHETQQENAQLMANSVTTFANLGDAWNKAQAAADPNDPNTKNLASDFMDKQVKPAVEAMGKDIGTVGGQDTYTKLSADITAKMFDKTNAGQAQLSGDAVVTALDRTKNVLGNAVYQDPSLYTGARDLANSSVDSLIAAHPDVPRAAIEQHRDKVQRSLAWSAVTGLAEKNPAAAKQVLQSGQFSAVFSQQDTERLSNYADKQSRAAFQAERQAKLQQKSDEKDAVDTAVNKLTSTAVQQDGSVTLPKDYFKSVAALEAQFPNQPPQTFRAAMDFGTKIIDDQEKGIKTVTDPHTFEDFRQRAALAPTDPNALTTEQVYQAAADGKLSTKDFSFYRGWVGEDNKNPQKSDQQKQLNQFFTGNKSFITKANPFMAIQDAQGDQRYMQFQQDKQQQYWAGIANGEKPYDLLSPSSKDYIGKDISRYQLSTSQTETGLGADTNTPPVPVKSAPPVRIKGESAADYLKRVGG